MFCLSACGKNTISETDSIIEERESTEVEQSTEIESEEMTGELLKNERELISETKEETVFTVDMNEVTEVICPAKVSLKRADVSYGEVSHFTYESETTKCTRGANILLPADYDENRKYPVLYFLHGIFGDENSMVKDGNNKIPEIVGNLKADGVIEDIIVIFPNMYASDDPELKPGFAAEQIVPYDNFINDLTNDLIPYVEEHYAVMTDREHRGIIGFSMGGRESLFIGISRSDLFAYIGAIAPAPGLTPAKDWAMEHIGQLQEDELVIKQEGYEPKLLMVCCGTKDSVVGQFPSIYHDILTRNQVDHLWYEIPEADHDSNAIKSGLYNYLIRWFYEE